MKLSRRDWLHYVGMTTGLSLCGQYALAQGEAIPTTNNTEPPSAPARDPLLDDVERAIAVTTLRKLRVGEHTPWQVVHGILALRQDMMMVQKDGSEISGIEWISSGTPWQGESIFEVTKYGGRGHPFSRKYHFEGHPTQFIGYMCEADLPLDFEIKTGTKPITIADIINDAKMQITEGPEVTWTLWALSHYLDSDQEWTNARGEPWNLERMVRIEYQQSVLRSACGGTHGLYALAYSRNKRLAQGKKLTGWWQWADHKVQQYIHEARALQNRDGSFSSAYFAGPGYAADFTKRIPSSGHTLEYLMCALPEKDLKQDWVRSAVASVAKDLIDNRKTPCDCAPLFHALHALKMYNFRVNPNAKTYSDRPPIQVVREKTSSVAPAPPEPAEISAQPESNTTRQ